MEDDKNGASVTILGIMAGKTMIRSGYDTRLSAGLICAGGTLGILIPPSIMLVVMGPVLEIPVTDLFAAAIIPGIMLASLYAGYTTLRCYLNPKLGPILPASERPKNMGKVWYDSQLRHCSGLPFQLFGASIHAGTSKFMSH